LKEHGVLETLQKLYSPVRLPAEITIKTEGCDGTVNAWFDSDDSVNVVHVCYELLQSILQNAPKETTPAGITPRDAIIGQVVFFVSHEMGHAMFDIFHVPVLGREEDAADQFATYIMLQFGKEQARRLVGGAAYAANRFVKEYKENPEVKLRLEKYSDVHGVAEQRFYNLICMAYGADPDTFADVVEKGILPKDRSENCDYEYQTFSYAWRREIGPHIDRRKAKAVLDTTWLPKPKPATRSR
jgi:hypothetical protein